ncbi:MAG: homoserine kinase [Caulobacteraceae bacterium]
MAVYTDITDGDLDTFLAAFDLGAPLALKGIAEGIENSNFLLETEAGRYILTIYERRVREEDLPYFITLMQWLAGHGFPSPTPQADRTGKLLHRLRDKPAALVSFLNGVSVHEPTVEHCHEAGEGLARLHLAAQGFPGHRANGLGHDAWRALYAGHEADLDELERNWPSGLPQGVIHADMFPDNVFFLHGKFAAVIDFYFACNDALAYDLAVCLTSWCFDAEGELKRAHAHALLAGYEAVRPLTSIERESLPLLSRGAALRFFLTRLIDWGSTPAGALVKPKNPLEYEAKLAFFRRPDAMLGLFETAL